MQTVLDQLRWRIQCSSLTQRNLERQLGFSKGYLSQVLRGHVDLKLDHLLSLLEALELAPAAFFSEVSEEPAPAAGPVEVEREIGAGLVGLYSVGLQSLDEIARRLDRCERLLAEARRRGLLDAKPASS